MATTKQDTIPYWSAGTTFPSFAKLAGNADADVVVVGGGITGLTAAYLLAKEGKRVVVLERRRCAETDTGHTSAHLTMVTDARLGELVTRFGRPHAQAVWDAGLAALATIDGIVRAHAIDADFAWVDGYLHAPRGGSARDDADTLRADAALASELGFDAEFVESVPLFKQPGVRFANQARIHPRKYLAGVATALVGPRRPHPRTVRSRRVLRPPASRQGQRTRGDVRGRRHRHAQSAGRLPQRGWRHAVPDEAGAVHQLRGGGTCRPWGGARRALVGHG